MTKLWSFVVIVILSLKVSAQEDINDLLLIAKDTSKYKYGRDHSVGKYYPVRGFKMYAEVYGTGKPLLLIHGNGGSIADFVFQIPYLSSKYKVIVADSRSHGLSVDPGDSLSYEMMADDFSELLNQMKIDSAYVIGWSDGGINGLLLAIRHPEKVKKLAVTGANLWPDTTAVFPDVENLVLPEYNSLKPVKNKTPMQKNNWKLLRLLIEEPHISLTDLHRITVPTLVIGGDHDVIKPGHTLLIAENIPNSYLWILPNSGHSTPWIYRNEFNRKTDEFFSGAYREFTGQKRFF
ncbi:MAG: alpha/beta fold hydrolase [Flavisolibacter sp.]